MKIKILLVLLILGLSFSSYKLLTINAPRKPDLRATGDYDFNNTSAYFHGERYDITRLALNNDVLGSKKKKSSGGQKRIEIDLSNQKLYAYEGNDKKYEFLVSTGKWYPTPTGDFRIYTKLRYALMAGGSKAMNTYYYLPNVPFTMYFYGGFGIHGTYWHNNFGHPMSHGCVNMKTEEAEKLFYWADPVLPEGKNSIYAQGTPVKIYGTAPRN